LNNFNIFFLLIYKKNYLKEKINGFINNCNRIKELYESDQQDQYGKESELIEIPEVDDNYKSMLKHQSQSLTDKDHNTTNPYKTLINFQAKPQKLFKTSLTKFQQSGLTNSSMRVRAVEFLNATNNNNYNQIHCLKKNNFFCEKNKINSEFKMTNEKNEIRKMSVSGNSAKIIKVKYLNEETEFEPLKTVLSTEGKVEKKIYTRPLTSHRPLNKENKHLGVIKTSPRINIIEFFL